MRIIIFCALLLISVLAQSVTAPTLGTEQSYLSTLSVLKKGYQVPVHLKGQSLLNSNKWATLQVNPEVKVEHKEAAAVLKQTLVPEKKANEHKVAEIDTPKVQYKYGGQVTIQKTNQISKSQKIVQVPLVAHSEHEAKQLHQHHASVQEIESAKERKNLRSEKVHEEKPQKVHPVEQQSQQSYDLIVPSPAPTPSPSPIEPTPKPSPTQTIVQPSVEPTVPAIAAPVDTLSPAGSLEPIVAEAPLNEVPVGDNPVFESETLTQVYGNDYPVLGEIKVPVEESPILVSEPSNN